MFANLWNWIRGIHVAPEVRERGSAGERHAVKLLEDKGYRIVDRNWRCASGELDVIVREGELLIFVEVKSAGKESAFRPEHRVNHVKRKRIKRLARIYLKAKRLDCPVRFDVVTVVWDDGKVNLQHFQNAF